MDREERASDVIAGPTPTLRQGYHQWWCVGVPCSCLHEWVAYDKARQAGLNPAWLPTAIVERPP